MNQTNENAVQQEPCARCNCKLLSMRPVDKIEQAWTIHCLICGPTTIISGATLREALHTWQATQQELQKHKVHMRLVQPYSIKEHGALM